jgi:hypothetical protein
MSWLVRLREFSQKREVPTPKTPTTPVPGVSRVPSPHVQEESMARGEAIDPGDAANINAWLDSIGEHDPAERAAVFARCAESPEKCALVVGVAVGAMLRWDEPCNEQAEAMRTCCTCSELAPSGLCRAAMRGVVHSATSTWQPQVDMPRRCSAYLPTAADRDQRSGLVRWGEVP